MQLRIPVSTHASRKWSQHFLAFLLSASVLGGFKTTPTHNY